MNVQLSGIDSLKVQRLVDRCSKTGIEDFSAALAAVEQAARERDIHLSEDEEGEAAQALLDR